MRLWGEGPPGAGGVRARESYTRPSLILSPISARRMALQCHFPSSRQCLCFFLSSTWGRADQHTSLTQTESEAFCFARNNFQALAVDRRISSPQLRLNDRYFLSTFWQVILKFIQQRTHRIPADDTGVEGHQQFRKQLCLRRRSGQPRLIMPRRKKACARARPPSVHSALSSRLSRIPAHGQSAISIDPRFPRRRIANCLSSRSETGVFLCRPSSIRKTRPQESGSGACETTRGKPASPEPFRCDR
jgi:hypothetical protein